MPRVTLSFKLPEESEEFDVHRNAYKYKLALDELDLWLRNGTKYGQQIFGLQADVDTTMGVADVVRKKIVELLNE